MNPSSEPRWFLTLNDMNIPVSSVTAILHEVDKAERLADGRFVVSYDDGPTPWWRRMLGNNRYVSGLFALEWTGNYAKLIFLDENWSEHHVSDKEQFADPGDTVRTKISHGASVPCNPKECMDKTRAFIAIRETLSSGNRPEWLSYRFVQ